MKGLTVAWSSLLMPTMLTFAPCFFCSSVRCGMLLRQGPHQVAQNSTTVMAAPGSTALPFIQVTLARDGALSPTSRAARGTARVASRARAASGRMGGSWGWAASTFVVGERQDEN